MPVEQKHVPERQQTDESLRVEREKTDEALDEIVAAIDEYADAVVEKARGQAAELLAAARKKSASRASRVSVSLTPAEVAQAAADLRAAADIADDGLRAERAEQLEILERERQVTDSDLERERERADAEVATRDEFLGIVSHDLRNMLHAVLGFTDLILEDPSPDPAKARAHARRIQRSGVRMNRLIGDLVDVASIDAGALRVCLEHADPIPVVLEAVELFHAQAEAKRVALEVTIRSPLPSIAFDPARIHQVLVNLLSNAIKFTPSGGRIDVSAAYEGDVVTIVVKDTGVGIPANRLEDVFERYRQVAVDDRRGVGLGLYISKCIVQGHRGRIWAESRQGEGSAFSFTIPVTPPE